MTTASIVAQRNVDLYLRQNPYPGRGLVIGRSTEADSWMIVYWIMGRSEHSRNRRFVVQDAVLRTEPVDSSRVVDPSLIIYEAMLELPGIYLISNGDQTRTVYEAMHVGGSFEEALATREREPDAPNFTPRISGMLDLNQQREVVKLSILKASPIDPAYTDRFTYDLTLPEAGVGFGLTTYAGDGNPLPSFKGDPLLLPLEGSAQQVLEAYWSALNSDNRISVAVKEIKHGTSTIVLRNRFE